MRWICCAGSDLWAVGVEWDRATRVDARDFSRWFQLCDKPARGRSQPIPAAVAVNLVTGRPSSGPTYAPRTVVHSETVLRQFYDVHRQCGTGPIINPFPLARQRWQSRPNAHHNPMLRREVARHE